MSHQVALVTDSTCDIPDELLDQYGIFMVPDFIVWGTEALRDRVEMGPEEFYTRLAVDPHHPSTSVPPPADFTDAYRAALAAGATEIVAITLSGAMSGLFQSATLGAQPIAAPIHLVDSRGAAMGLGWQVLAAARAREAGADAAGMIAAADRARASMVMLVALDTLEYLYKGGRIGNASRFIGSLLNVKPLICINHQSGLVEQAGRSRTRRQSIDALYDEFFQRLGTRRPIRIAVLHGNVPEEASVLADRVRQEHHPVELLVRMTGPILGTHVGPGALALCGYVDD